MDTDEGEGYVVEKILDKRIKGDLVEYYLKWETFSDEHNTWEPVDNMDCPGLIEEYELKLMEEEKRNRKQTAVHVKRESLSDDEETQDQKIPENGKKRIAKIEQEPREITVKKEKNIIDDVRVNGDKRKRTSKGSSLTSKAMNQLKNNMVSDGVLGFSRGLEPMEILAASDLEGRIIFLMRWRDSDVADFVYASEARARCPQLVIAYYEQFIEWK